MIHLWHKWYIKKFYKTRTVEGGRDNLMGYTIDCVEMFCMCGKTKRIAIDKQLDTMKFYNIQVDSEWNGNNY